jgi:hypothetical protein
MTIPSGMLMHPDNIGRPLDARWRRVSDLADRGEPAKHRWDDSWVKRGLEYEKRRRACRDQADRELLARHDPDLDAAHAVRHGDDKLARGELEARLLTGQSATEVASLCRLPVGAVAAYAKLFILIEAVGPVLWDGTLKETDVDALVKWIAFIKGPILLDVLLRYFKCGFVVPDRLEEASAEQLEDLASMLQMRALVVTWTRPWPHCARGVRLCELAEELRSSIPWLTAPPAPAGQLYVGAAFPAREAGAEEQVEVDAPTCGRPGARRCWPPERRSAGGGNTMGWETRGKGRYYTRSRKVGGRVVREYVGAGAVGELAAALDALRRRRRQAARAERLAERRRWGDAELAAEGLAHNVALLLNAALLAAGFHQHDRTWRRRRR